MTNIHSTAVVDKAAQIGQDVFIGPYCVIGPNVSIHDGAELISHVVIDGWTTIGKGCRVFPFACLGMQTQDLKYKGGKTFVVIGENTMLRESVTVNSGTNEGEVVKVGSGCLIMAYCHVAHGCTVGDGVIMSNVATLAGHVIVEDHAIISGLTGIHQFVRVGTMCMVGGLSKITQDCPPYMLIDGNPSAVIGLNSVGLKRKNVTEDVQHTLKKAHKIIFRQGLATSQAIDKVQSELTPCAELQHLVDFIKKSERGIVK